MKKYHLRRYPNSGDCVKNQCHPTLLNEIWTVLVYGSKTLEIVSFGTLGKLYSNFKDNAVKKVVARSFNVPQYVYLESWIASLAALRNGCAHHARVWNRVYPIKPQLPLAKRMRSEWIDVSNVARNRLYAMLCCLVYWVNNIQPDNNVKAEIVKLLGKYPVVDKTAIGFPTGWEMNAFWR